MAHIIDYDKPVSNITITLLTNDDDPYANDLIQHVSKLIGNALVELRVKFPREKWEYFGVHYEEWLAGEPMDDPYLVSEGDFSHEKITLIPPDLPPSDEGGLAQKEQENSPSVDKETSHERSREDVIAEGIESKNLRINEGVVPFLITRKYFPLEKCITCYQKNTDFCRLVCESEAETDLPT